MRRYVISRLAILLFVAPARAYDAQGNFQNLGFGTKSCGEIVADFKANERSQLSDSIWVAGFLTAYNYYVHGRLDISRGVDVASRDLWINNYCTAHPLKKLVDAAAAFVTELKGRGNSE